jgi:hypothetical protein
MPNDMAMTNVLSWFARFVVHWQTVSTLTKVFMRDVNCISTMVVASLSNFYNNSIPFTILSYAYHLLLPTAITPHMQTVGCVGSVKPISIPTGSHK